MAIAEFIADRLDALLAEWEQGVADWTGFSGYLGSEIWRDDSRTVLEFLPPALRPPDRPTATARVHGSRRILEGYASRHGMNRFWHGFDPALVAGEFAGLRRTLVGSWRDRLETFGEAELRDVIDLEDVLDDVMTASIRGCATQEEGARQLRDRTLAHALRNPLGTISLATGALLMQVPGTAPDRVMIRLIERNVDRIGELLWHQPGYAARGPQVLPLTPRLCDLGTICRDTLIALQADQPPVRLMIDASGHLEGRWDAQCLQEMLSALFLGAVTCHPDTPVRFSVQAETDGVQMKLESSGQPLAAAELSTLFPTTSLGVLKLQQDQFRNLAFSLLLARQTCVAHGGATHVVCTPTGIRAIFLTLPWEPTPSGVR